MRVGFGNGDKVHLQVCGTARITCDFKSEAALENERRALELSALDIFGGCSPSLS